VSYTLIYRPYYDYRPSHIQERWGTLHYNVAKEMNHSWKNSIWTDAVTSARYPWVEVLTDRERGVLELVETEESRSAEADNEEELWELSQTIKRGQVVSSGVPCLKPGGKPWLKKRRRLLVPEERLAIQGIFASREIMDMFSSMLKNSLAGNAFSGPVFMVIFLALMSAIAEKLKREGRLVADDDEVNSMENLASLMSFARSSSSACNANLSMA